MRLPSLLLAALVVTGCGRTSDDAVPGTPVDSSAVTALDSVALDSTARDSMAEDSSARDSGVVSGPAKAPAMSTPATKTPNALSKAAADSIIGRDSAFGPKYSIDSKGNMIPIKPPPTPIKRPTP